MKFYTTLFLLTCVIGFRVFNFGSISLETNDMLRNAMLIGWMLGTCMELVIFGAIGLVVDGIAYVIMRKPGHDQNA